MLISTLRKCLECMVALMHGGLVEILEQLKRHKLLFLCFSLCVSVSDSERLLLLLLFLSLLKQKEKRSWVRVFLITDTDFTLNFLLFLFISVCFCLFVFALWEVVLTFLHLVFGFFLLLLLNRALQEKKT